MKKGLKAPVCLKCHKQKTPKTRGFYFITTSRKSTQLRAEPLNAAKRQSGTGNKGPDYRDHTLLGQ